MAETIDVIVSGIPGNMAMEAAKLIAQQPDMRLYPYALSSDKNSGRKFNIEGYEVETLGPSIREEILKHYTGGSNPIYVVDYTTPGAVEENVKFYVDRGLWPVIGTTMPKETLERIVEIIESSDVSAVISPNMAMPIVAIMSAIECISKEFPGVFRGYKFSIVESHQQSKRDVSGTARKMVPYFNELTGRNYDEGCIISIRDPGVQENVLRVPKEHLNGHGWHTYMLKSPDGSVEIKIIHNVNGRIVYAEGTVAALRFLHRKCMEGITGKVYSIKDVMRTFKDFNSYI